MGILSRNLYYTFFCTLDHSCNLKIHEIWIRSNVGLDQKIFNAPSSSQVATIWVENDAPAQPWREILWSLTIQASAT